MADDHPNPEPGGPERGSDPAGLRGRDLLGLGGLLVGGVVGGLVIGYLVDHVAGTDPVFTLLGVFVGIAGAVAGFAVRVREALRPGGR